MQKKNIPLYSLGVINLICVILHAVFQLDLLADGGIYREFTLIENSIITFIFLYFAVVMFFGDVQQKQMIVTMNIFFWIVFLLSEVAIQPTVTSLSILGDLIIFPQKYYLFFTGFNALVLSIVSYRQLKQA